MQTYEQAIEFLYGRINYERAVVGSYSANDFKLDRMRELLSRLVDPHERLPVVHITGTKGKGSTAATVAEILVAAGYRVGLFTSPHIAAFEERMRVDGVSPSPAEVVALVNRLAEPVAEMDRAPRPLSPTYFEIATAMAWLHFQQRQVDIAVLEVGLGGRLDSTNLCNPEVTAITNISRDHTMLLGSTLAEIAGEKAGIIKSGIPVVSGVDDRAAQGVIQSTSDFHNARLWQLGREIHWTNCADSSLGSDSSDPHPDACHSVQIITPLSRRPNIQVSLPGDHQAANTAVAVGIIDALIERGWKISERAVREGVARLRLPLRIEVLCQRPTAVVDAAHNWASVSALLKTLPGISRAKRRILIFATSKDKDVSGMLRLLLPNFQTVIFTRYLNNPRAVSVEDLAGLAQEISDVPVHFAADPSTAWRVARRLANREDLICAAGSFFIAAEIREIILDESETGGQADQTKPAPAGRMQNGGRV